MADGLETIHFMRAAVLYGKEDVRVEQVSPVALKPGEVRVAIEAALTCGTDLKVFRRGYHARMIVPPAVFGHELAGTISELGDGVREWRVGDRVVVANSAPCGVCPACLHQQESLCEDLLFLNGAYAESIVVPARVVEKNMLRLNAATQFVDAALVEPLACVVQGAEDSGLARGQRVLIVGAGPIGLMFAALGMNRGCDVTVAGRGEARLETARRIGARTIVKVAQGENVEAAVKAAMLAPFDVVIEAVGQPATWEASVRLVRKGGLVNFFGGCPSGTSVSLDTALLHYSSLTLKASFHHTPGTIRSALGLIERGVVTARLFVDGECPLSRLPELFKNMSAGNRAVKTLIRVAE
jgi:L-iditol 2-dehydrogenase